MTGEPPAARRARNWPFIAALAVLLAFQAWAYASRLPLSLGPRVILQPWLLRHGFVQYETIADLHSPLLPLSLAALTPLLSDGLALARLALVTLLTLTTLLTFVAGRRTLGWLGGLAAACFVAAWSPKFGFGKLWHESLLAPLYLLLYLRFDASAGRRPPVHLVVTGMLGGIAILVKQHAALVLVAFVMWRSVTQWLAHRRARQVARDIGWVAVGATLPVAAIVVLQLARAGTLQGMMYWTLGYSLTSAYGRLAAQAPTARQVETLVASGLLLPAAIGVCVHSARKHDSAGKQIGLLLVLMAAASATAYPRYGSFHLQAALPLLALASTGTLVYLLRSLRPRRWIAYGLAMSALAVGLAASAAGYRPVLHPPSAQPVAEYGNLVPLAEQVRELIGPDDCVYLFPDDEATSNLYYLLGCTPPGFWIFHYPWYLDEPIRQRILRSLEASPPEWIVHFPEKTEAEHQAPDIMAWISASYRRTAVLSWAQGEAWLLKR